MNMWFRSKKHLYVHSIKVDNDAFAYQAISDLVTSGCAVTTQYKPLIVNPLSVEENSVGKKRLILDLRETNNCIWKEKIFSKIIKLL